MSGHVFQVVNGITYFAQGYGCDAYGASTYGECQVAPTPQPSGPAGVAGSILADTGMAATALVTLACILIGLGIVLRSFHRKRRHYQA